MIYAGIDVAKNKHDCFITNSDGEMLFQAFSIPNNRNGFDAFYQKILSVTDDLTKVKVGLEATGHYNYNILRYLLDKGLTTFVINPLHTNLYRKSLSLRKTKTDKVDAHTIATMLMSDVNLKSYSDKSYHNEELKSLIRYRFDKVKARAKLKSSVSRLVTILFPELESLVSTLHMTSVYVLLSEFPSASDKTGKSAFRGFQRALYQRHRYPFPGNRKSLDRLSDACQIFGTKAYHQTHSGTDLRDR